MQFGGSEYSGLFLSIAGYDNAPAQCLYCSIKLYQAREKGMYQAHGLARR